MALDRRHRDTRNARPASGRLRRGTASPGSRPLARGFGSKLHAVVDALGLPVRFALGPGQQKDMAPACDLIRSLPAHRVIGDKAYDTNSLYELVLEQGGQPVIPPRSHRKYQHRYGRIVHEQRWGIEGFFARLEQWRRIATRYEKLAANFLGFVKLASIMLWLK